jgi:hypothetical protein
MMQTVINWESEHGKEYEVPEEILKLCTEGVARDMSWHNDLCPCFGRLKQTCDSLLACIWVDHPDPAKRENIDKTRFLVCKYDGDGNESRIFATDDARAAIQKYRKFVK